MEKEQLIVDTEWVQSQIDAATADLRRQLEDAQLYVDASAAMHALVQEITDETIDLRRKLAEAQAANVRRASDRVVVINEAVAHLARLTMNDFHGYRSEVWAAVAAVYDAGKNNGIG